MRDTKVEGAPPPEGTLHGRSGSPATHAGRPPRGGRAGAWSAALVASLALACGGPDRAASGPSTKGGASPGTLAGKGESKVDEGALRARDDLAPDDRALLVVDGSERWVDAKAIEAAGYTLVDLSDDWTPTLFADEHAPDGTPLPNRYRRVLIGLSNDRLDNDGEPLAEGDKNYLELYGVFPSFSVLRDRFVQDSAKPCHDPESVAVLGAVETIAYVPPNAAPREAQKLARAKSELEAARKRANLTTLDELAASRADYASKLAFVQKREAENAAMSAVEERLACEKMFAAQPKHATGVYDEAMRLSVRRFQQKHMIYEANFLRRKTVEALARPLVDNDYDALTRALRERVVSAAGVLEDGTGGSAKEPAKNLVEDFTQAALKQLGLTGTEAAQAFFERHPKEHFARLRAAVKLPAVPEYYGPAMDLSIVVDRGDVWYDLPFDDAGHFRERARSHYPTLSLYTTYQGQKIRLASWRTTVGGWRSEQAPNGYEYYRYKGSDVGPRVIRKVVSGPVWIAPPSTPLRGLVKTKVVNSTWSKIINYDELGPGYLSAYGLVAGYFVQPGQDVRTDYDNGVRAHGSSDYLSIYNPDGFSHGCHRLPNHVAVRLYSFILRHRNTVVAGDQPLAFSRQFLQDDNVYEIRLASRGYMYLLDPPLPVLVLEGNVRGPQKTPITGYVPKPDTEYPPGPVPPVPDSPEAKAAGE